MKYDFKDEISPRSISFAPRQFQFSGKDAQIMYISAYPTTVANIGWLSAFAAEHGIDMTLSVEKMDRFTAKQLVDRAVRETNAKLHLNGGLSDSARFQKELELQMYIVNEMDTKNEEMVLATPLFLITGDDSDELRHKRMQLTNILSQHNMSVQTLVYQQEALLQHYLPQNNFALTDTISRIMPTKSLASSYPLIFDSLQDTSYPEFLTTTYLGKDASGGNVFLNQFANLFERDNKQIKRTNGNTVIIGNSGSGKSTLAKKLMTMHNLQKTKIIVIDPEREYKELCENLGGEWIDAASANGVTINPLEIQKSDDENFETMSLVAYLPVLRKLGAILFRLDEYTETLFERACRETYWEFGIKNETDVSKLKSTDYPVFSDVLQTIKKILVNEDLSREEKSGYEKIRVFLDNIVHGAEGRMWNQPTTLKANSDFIVLDIHSLLDTDDRLRNAQMYLLLGWAWTQLAKERNDVRSRKMLFIDEAHLLIDPHYKHALDFLRATIKRARKYNASVVTITQQIEDFFYEDVKKYGEALFEQSTYVFIGKQSPKGVNTLTHIMELSQSERDRLQYPSRGQFLLAITNDRRMELHLRVDPFELELFGNGGGR